MHPAQFAFYLALGALLGGALWSGTAKSQALVIEICGHSASTGSGSCGGFGGAGGTTVGALLGAEVGSINVGAEGAAARIPIMPTTKLPVPPGWSASGAGVVQPVAPSSTASRTYTGAGGMAAGLGPASSLAALGQLVIDGLPTSGFGCHPSSSATYSLVNVTATSADVYAHYEPTPDCVPGVIGGFTATIGCPSGYAVSGADCVLTDSANVDKPADGKCGLLRSGNTITMDSKDPDCTNPSSTAGQHGVAVSGGQVDAAVGDSTVRTVIDGSGNTEVTVKRPSGDGNTTVTEKFTVRGGTGNSPYTVSGTSSATEYGAGTLAGTGTAPAGKDPCGIPGSPPCKIDETGTPTAGSVTQGGTFGAGNAVLDAAKSGTLDKITTFDPGKGGVAPGAGWFPTLSGSDTCTEPVTWTFMGSSMPLNVCDIYAPFKAVMAWALWLFLAVFAWQRVTRGAAAAVG